MPRKAKKNAEAETAGLIITPELEHQAGDAASRADSDLPTIKPARKKRAKKADAEPAPEAEAEAKAQAADTFEQAFDEVTPSESAAEPAPAPKKPAPKKKRPASTATEAEPEPVAGPVAAAQPASETQPADEGKADADEELAGDWEFGSSSAEGEEGGQGRSSHPPAKLERLQKILAAAGIASRRHAEELITQGRVLVNGKVVTVLGSKADPQRDHIRVDGKLLQGAERLRYFVLNKPRGYVTTVSDPEGRPTVVDFFSKMGERLYPVGRLDFQSEGLLLMTNDGELANKLTRAASGVEKTYLVKVSGQPDEELLDRLRDGLSIDRGRAGEGRVRTAPAQIRQVRAGDNPWFEVILIEGRNRELRKMFEEIGHHVEKIRRVGYGPLVLDVEPGQLRELDAEELNLLRLAADGKWKPRRIKTSSMLPKEAGRSVDHETRGERGRRPFKQGGGGRRDQGGQERRPSFGQDRGAGRGERQGPPAKGTGRRESFRPRREQGGADDRPRSAERPQQGGAGRRFGTRPEFKPQYRPAGTGSARTGSAGARSAGTGPVGTRSAGTGSARTGAEERRFTGRPPAGDRRQGERPAQRGGEFRGAERRPQRGGAEGGNKRGFGERGSRPPQGDRGAAGQRFGKRPAGAGGFRPEGRTGGGRGPVRGPAREAGTGFGENSRRPYREGARPARGPERKEGRPPRREEGTRPGRQEQGPDRGQEQGRREFRSQPRGQSGGGRQGGGGRSRFGSGGTGRQGSGAGRKPQGNRGEGRGPRDHRRPR